jgi:Leucine rich repeat
VKLRVLDLSYNEVQVLEAKVFIYLTSLVMLNLRNNRISQISPDVFLQEGAHTANKSCLSLKNIKNTNRAVIFYIANN